LFVIVVVNIFLLLRAAYPRMRYDILIILTWKKCLPLVLIFYLFIVEV
jgi:NADH:ubiquinone oxidoreductase subunit H